MSAKKTAYEPWQDNVRAKYSNNVNAYTSTMNYYTLLRDPDHLDFRLRDCAASAIGGAQDGTDIGAYQLEHGSKTYYIPGMSEAREISVPIPPPDSTGVMLDTSLMWKAATEATGHTVYFDGVEMCQLTGEENVCDIDTSKLDTTAFDATTGLLNPGQRYEWSVLSAFGDGSAVGADYAFTTHDGVTTAAVAVFEDAIVYPSAASKADSPVSNGAQLHVQNYQFERTSYMSFRMYNWVAERFTEFGHPLRIKSATLHLMAHINSADMSEVVVSLSENDFSEGHYPDEATLMGDAPALISTVGSIYNVKAGMEVHIDVTPQIQGLDPTDPAAAITFQIGVPDVEASSSIGMFYAGSLVDGSSKDGPRIELEFEMDDTLDGTVMDDLLEDRTQDFEKMSVTSSGVQLPVKQLEAAMRCATARLSGATAAVEKAGAQEYETVEGVFSLSVSDGRGRTLLDATGETAFGAALDVNYDAVKDILLHILVADEVELTFENGTNKKTDAKYVAMYFDEEMADAMYDLFDVDSFDTAVEKRIGDLSGFEGWRRGMRVREEGRPSRGTKRRSDIIAQFPRLRRPTTTGGTDICSGSKKKKCTQQDGCSWSRSNKKCSLKSE